MRTTFFVAVITWLVIAQPRVPGAAANHVEQPVSPTMGNDRLPPASFRDANRRARLAEAYADIDRMFTEFVSNERVPGGAWGVVIDGDLAHRGATGMRDIATKAPVTADTVFRIASMTKSFTAMAILKLRDDGKLRLDDAAEQYVGELKQLAYPSADSRRITIRDLLSHAAGFPEDNPWGDQQLGEGDAEMSRMMRSGIPFSNTPGVAYEYSNYGFAILGRIVSRVSGMPYRDYINASILQPLKMSSTTLDPAAVDASRLARGYRWEDGMWKPEPLLPDGSFGAMGGMLTSINDLAKYVSLLLSAWPPRDGLDPGPLRRASLREMQQVWRAAPANITRDANSGTVQLNAGGYGFGLRISQSCAFGHLVGHGGGLPGFGSLMRWLPEYGVGLIAMGNLTYTGWGRTFDRALERLARTGGLQPRMPQPSRALTNARVTISNLLVKWDDAAADRIAAENLFLDRSKERRRNEIAALVAKVGSCDPTGDFDYVENALRGQWVLKCTQGSIRVSITLAPTIPPTVQYLEAAPASPFNDPARRATCPSS